ncbi:MAG: D-alanyl-D-alanine carboxypeptidase/D-alanyl-D-alanine-endopeptidase, partial [Phycisphaerae bacterium]
TSGLNFNDNCVDITIFPTEEGQPVRYEVMPPVQNITVINECVTGEKHEPTIEKLPEGDVYKLGGTCAEKAELKSKPVGNPGQFFCDALRMHFASRGIVIEGETKRATAPLGGWIPPPPDKIVAVHETNVPDIIGRINTNSQNFFAEAFCKLTGQARAARAGRYVPGSWGDGDKAIRAFLRECEIDDRHLVVADGSGLSDENKVTSRLLTDLFAVMFARPDGKAFVDSLARGGVNGSLEKRFAGLEGHVFAKTGYISGVRALSGYVRTYDGEWLTFAIIYNNIPGSVKPYEALQDEAVRLLIQWPNLKAAPTTQPANATKVRVPLAASCQ